MSNRPGRVSSLIFAAQTLGAAAGRNFPLSTLGPMVVPQVFIAYVASATVGNRLPVVQIRDALGNILFQTVATTNITAGQTPKLILANSLSYLAITSPLAQMIPWPGEAAVPQSGSLQVFDSANVDVADTVAVNATVVI